MRKFTLCFTMALAVCQGLEFAYAKSIKQTLDNATTTRFNVNEGEVFDEKTQLTWSRCSVGVTWKQGVGCVGSPKLMSLDEAKHFAKKLGNGWRVPTIDELCSILEPRRGKNAINQKVFPDIRDLGEGEAPYWSITKVEDVPTLVYYADFMRGRVDGHSKGFALAVRLVRSRQR